MSSLFVIPARGGSKGIPGKNIKMLGDKPLISYSIDIARSIVSDENICVSTDDQRIIKVVESLGLKIPFTRPAHLATDQAGTFEVVLHALNFFEQQGKFYESIVLLQPTSPFRTTLDVLDAMKVFDLETDMVVSVKETKSNPYFMLFEESSDGYLYPSKTGNFFRRQDVPKVYEYNGAIYVINTRSLRKYNSLRAFQKVKKYVMDEFHSLDIDQPIDWKIAEIYLEQIKQKHA